MKQEDWVMEMFFTDVSTDVMRSSDAVVQKCVEIWSDPLLRSGIESNSGLRLFSSALA